jgi:hypothetical protein
MTTIYTLNEAGQHQVRSFVENHGKPGLNANAWFSEAESAANDGFDRGMQAVIELGARYSETGNPQTLVLEQAWFDADESDEDSEDGTYRLSFTTTTKLDFGGFRFYVEAGRLFDADDYAAAYKLNRSDIDAQDIHSAQDAAGRLNPGEWLEVTHEA